MFNPMDLTGRTILVTGASSGIGRATSVVLSRLGAKVILVGRNADELDRTAEMLESAPHRIESRDLSDTESIPKWLKTLAEQEGPLNGLVHSAGVHTPKPVRFVSTDDVESLMRINFTSAVQLTKGFRQRKVVAAPAAIVFVSSILERVGQPAASLYSASKGALGALARSLALELAPEQIRVNCVAPGVVRTAMTQKFREQLTEQQFADIEAMHPLGLGEPVNVAHSVAFLLGATGSWITGSTLVVDGGYTAH